MNNGLTYEELQELLQYIEKNHSWKNMFELNYIQNKKNKIIKYVDFKFDTRDCKIWFVEFYSIIGGNDDTKKFRTEKNYNLKEEIYKWLREDI